MYSNVTAVNSVANYNYYIQPHNLIYIHTVYHILVNGNILLFVKVKPTLITSNTFSSLFCNNI